MDIALRNQIESDDAADFCKDDPEHSDAEYDAQEALIAAHRAVVHEIAMLAFGYPQSPMQIVGRSTPSVVHVML